MPSVKVIIFDIDGTLLNTDELYFKLLKKELYKSGISLNEKQYGVYGLDDSIFHLGLSKKIATKINQSVLKKYYQLQTLKKVRFKKGVSRTIQALYRKYNLAIGSGEKLEQVMKYLDQTNSKHYFQFIGHGGLVNNRKSNPEYFQLIAKFFKVKTEECLMVGDSLYDTEAAKAGCKVVITPSKFTKHNDFKRKYTVLHKISDLIKFLKSDQYGMYT